MTVSVQSAAARTAKSGSVRLGIIHQPVIQYHPGAITSDTKLAAYLAQGRALQGRALRQGLAAAVRPLTEIFGNYGRLRQRYARVPIGPFAAS